MSDNVGITVKSETITAQNGFSEISQIKCKMQLNGYYYT